MPLVTTKDMFKKAYAGGYAIGAFNVNNMEIIQGIVEAAKEEASPVILQVTNAARLYAKPIYLKKLMEAAVEESGLPICLHLDHGDSFETCKKAIADGFTSVMIDASAHSFNENVELTKHVVDYAHDYGAVVEGNLGITTTPTDGTDGYTQPELAVDFIAKTGVDSLSVSVGTTDGAYKFKGAPFIRMDVIEEIGRLLPGFPLVLHGASSVLPSVLEMIKQTGGSLPGAKGVPESILRQAASSAVCKINIDSDLRLAFTAAIRKHLIENPAHVDPRQYLTPAREAVKNCVKQKINNVLGCAGMSSSF